MTASFVAKRAVQCVDGLVFGRGLSLGVKDMLGHIELETEKGTIWGM